jgi:hypothetical protein
MTAAQLKAQLKGEKSSHPGLIPRAGTRIRELYDLFMDHKGELVTYGLRPNDGNHLRCLRDEYGFDLRCLKRQRRGPSQWCLVGELVGDRYVDYVAQRLRLGAECATP